MCCLSIPFYSSFFNLNGIYTCHQTHDGKMRKTVSSCIAAALSAWIYILSFCIHRLHVRSFVFTSSSNLCTFIMPSHNRNNIVYNHNGDCSLLNVHMSLSAIFEYDHIIIIIIISFRSLPIYWRSKLRQLLSWHGDYACAVNERRQRKGWIRNAEHCKHVYMNVNNNETHRRLPTIDYRIQIMSEKKNICIDSHIIWYFSSSNNVRSRFRRFSIAARGPLIKRCHTEWPTQSLSLSRRKKINYENPLPEIELIDKYPSSHSHPYSTHTTHRA